MTKFVSKPVEWEIDVTIRATMRGPCDGIALYLDYIDVNTQVILYYGFFSVTIEN